MLIRIITLNNYNYSINSIWFIVMRVACIPSIRFTNYIILHFKKYISIFTKQNTNK